MDHYEMSRALIKALEHTNNDLRKQNQMLDECNRILQDRYNDAILMSASLASCLSEVIDPNFTLNTTLIHEYKLIYDIWKDFNNFQK